MTVTVDVSPAIHGKAGLGRYAASLATAVDQTRPAAIRMFGNSIGTQTFVPLPSVPMKTIRMGYKGWRMAVLAGQVARIGFDALLDDTELYHATEHLLLPLRRIPTVLTVHDLIFRLFPQYHKKLNYWYLNAAMPVFTRRASHIIAVSQQTKNDLVRHYGTPPDKITVIYEAAAPHFRPQPTAKVEEVRARYHLLERYLLTVGTIEPRKNLPRLVEALAALRRDDPDLRLVVVGAKGWLYEGFFEAIERFGQRDGVILPGYVPDGDLSAMYSGAIAAVCASLYEGFGLPVLEAMACGAPVACSATSSVGEIAGEAALTFDPENGEAITDALRQMLSDDDLRESLRQKGLARAAEFSWERAAQETWAVYDRVIDKRFA